MTDPFATPERRALRETVRRFVAREVAAPPRRLGARRRAAALAAPARRRARAARAVLPRGRRRRRRRRDRRARARRGDALRRRRPAGCSPALFTSGISLPHIVARGRRRPDRPLRAARPSPGELIGSLAITEPDGGSDVAGIRTTAKRDGDDYVVNGAKTYITSAVRGDFVVTAVRTGDRGAHGISLLVVEKGTPGFTVSRKLDKMGWLCSDTAELSYVDVRVPAANLVGAENSGFVQIAQNFVSPSGSAWPCRPTPAPSAASTSPCEWCRDRETFGRPLDQPAGGAEHPGRDGPPHRGGPRLHALGRRCGPLGEPNLDPRGVLRQEHRRRGRRVGRRPGRPAARRHGLHARGRGRAAVPRHAHPRHRRRHHRDPHRPGRQDCWDTPA